MLHQLLLLLHHHHWCGGAAPIVGSGISGHRPVSSCQRGIDQASAMLVELPAHLQYSKYSGGTATHQNLQYSEAQQRPHLQYNSTTRKDSIHNCSTYIFGSSGAYTHTGRAVRSALPCLALPAHVLLGTHARANSMHEYGHLKTTIDRPTDRQTNPPIHAPNTAS